VTPEELLFKEQANLYRLQQQVDFFIAGITNGAHVSPVSIFTEDTIKYLHKVAMAGILDSPGEYRQAPVRINNSPHVPPSWLEVPALMGTLCRYVRLNWEQCDLIHLAAFVLWRLNWIHPFMNGNGRTARGVAYLTMCAKHGGLLPAQNTVVQQIVKNRDPYYVALRSADDLYKQYPDDLNRTLKPITDLLGFLLKEQIRASLA